MRSLRKVQCCDQSAHNQKLYQHALEKYVLSLFAGQWVDTHVEHLNYNYNDVPSDMGYRYTVYRYRSDSCMYCILSCMYSMYLFIVAEEAKSFKRTEKVPTPLRT